MNKKLILTDICIATVGFATICFVQLLKSTNPALLANTISLTLFTVGIILFSILIMLYSYKNNNESVTRGNLIIQATLSLLFASCILAFDFADIFGPDYPVCFSFSGLFASRFMFSRSIYIKEHKTTKRIKLSFDIDVKPIYSKNISEDPSEAMKTIGYMILFCCALFLIILTVNSYYPIIV